MMLNPSPGNGLDSLGSAGGRGAGAAALAPQGIGHRVRSAVQIHGPRPERPAFPATSATLRAPGRTSLAMDPGWAALHGSAQPHPGARPARAPRDLVCHAQAAAELVVDEAGDAA